MAHARGQAQLLAADKAALIREVAALTERCGLLDETNMRQVRRENPRRELHTMRCYCTVFALHTLLLYSYCTRCCCIGTAHAVIVFAPFTQALCAGIFSTVTTTDLISHHKHHYYQPCTRFVPHSTSKLPSWQREEVIEARQAREALYDRLAAARQEARADFDSSMQGQLDAMRDRNAAELQQLQRAAKVGLTTAACLNHKCLASRLVYKFTDPNPFHVHTHTTTTTNEQIRYSTTNNYHHQPQQLTTHVRCYPEVFLPNDCFPSNHGCRRCKSERARA